MALDQRMAQRETLFTVSLMPITQSRNSLVTDPGGLESLIFHSAAGYALVTDPKPNSSIAAQEESICSYQTQRCKNSSLPIFPSHSAASARGSLRVVITGHSFESAAFKAM